MILHDLMLYIHTAKPGRAHKARAVLSGEQRDPNPYYDCYCDCYHMYMYVCIYIYIYTHHYT